MKAATFDPAVLLTLYTRKARRGSKTFRFKDANGDPFDISAIDFEYRLKKWVDGDDVLVLSLGSGLSKPAINDLQLDYTEEEMDIDTGNYFYEIVNLSVVKTWLNGDQIVHNGKFDGIENPVTDIIIQPEGDVIEVTIIDSQAAPVVESSAEVNKTLTPGGNKVFFFTGNAPSTWTMYAITGNQGSKAIIKNIGSAALTLQRGGTDSLYDAQAVNSIELQPGMAQEIFTTATYHVLL